MHFTLKTNPLKRADLDEFVKLYKPEEPRAKRRSNWSEEKTPEGRWRSFDYDEIIKRDKANGTGCFVERSPVFNHGQ